MSGQKTANRRPSLERYDAFFAAERARGVSYPQFSGGEPSLNPGALQIAAQHWTSGIIYTNGIRRIPASVPFRIAISIWGCQDRNDRLRGTDAYRQALSVAEGDARAIIYFTINRDNVEDIPSVVSDCANRGLKLSFNDFSMTTEYIRLLAAGDNVSNPYVRTSSSEENLSLRASDRFRAADLIDQAMIRCPETILYNRVINDFVHRSTQIFDIDSTTGLARDCAYLDAEWHRGYDFNLERLKGKQCCAPEFDCSDCRIGPAATFKLMMSLAGQMRKSETARQELTALREYMMSFYFVDWNLDSAHAEVSRSTSREALEA